MRNVEIYMDDNTPIASPDLWAEIIRTSHRQVAKTDLGDIRVSTVFLGLDHSFDDGPSLLFETMIFGDPFDQDEYLERSSTWEAAEAQHAKAVEVVRKSLKWPCGAGPFSGVLPPAEGGFTCASRDPKRHIELNWLLCAGADVTRRKIPILTLDIRKIGSFQVSMRRLFGEART